MGLISTIKGIEDKKKRSSSSVDTTGGVNPPGLSDSSDKSDSGKRRGLVGEIAGLFRRKRSNKRS